MTDRPWIIYTRVSDDDQVEGASLDAQAGYCRHWLLAKGISEMRVVSDEGFSAWRPGHLERPGLVRIMAAARRQEIAGLVVWKMDRWCRKVRDLLDLLEELGRAGVSFASVTEQIDTSSAVGRFQAQLLGALAELESGRTSERIRAAMLHIRSKGGHVGGRAPAGLQIIGAKGDRKLVPLQPHAEAVSGVWAKISAGATLSEVAQYLTAATVPCHGKAQAWSTAAAHKLITNPTYVGRLVTQEDWDAAVAALEARACPIRDNRGTGGRKSLHGLIWPLAGGIGRCGGCGGALVGAHGRSATGKIYRYYRCSGRAQKGDAHCRSKDLPAEPWEQAVVQVLQQYATGGDLAAQLAAQVSRTAASTPPLEAERKRLQLDHDRLRAEISRLVDMAASGALVATALADGLSDRQRQLAEVDRQIGELDARLSVEVIAQADIDARAERLRQGLGNLAGLDAAAQADAIRLFVREVHLKPDPADKHSGEVDLSIDLPEGSKESSNLLTDMVEVRRLPITLRRRVVILKNRAA